MLGGYFPARPRQTGGQGMKAVLAIVAVTVASLSFEAVMVSGTNAPRPHPRAARPATPPSPERARIETLNEVIDFYCVDCHSDSSRYGNLTLEGYDIARAA